MQPIHHLFLATAVAAGVSIPASAAVVVTVEDVEATEVTSGVGNGFFDVVINLTEGSTFDDLTAFQVSVELETTTDVELTGLATPDDYVFPGGAPTGTVTASAVTGGDFLNVGSVVVDDGDGLLRVNFSYTPVAAGVYEVSVVAAALFDDLGVDPSVTTAPGFINITPIPEPMSLSAIGLLGCFGLRRRRTA